MKLMESLLPMETVVLTSITKLPADEFGEVKTVKTDHTVPGCLVQPGSSVDLPEGFELNQTNTLTVHIPTTFTEKMEGGYATVRGVRYSVVVATVPLTSSPLPWNRQVILKVTT